MTHRVVGLAVLLAAFGCKPELPRPDVPPSRMLEPQLPEGIPTPVAEAPDAVQVRLLASQAADPIGHPILHRSANGELRKDAVWSWSSTPDRYLDTVLHVAAASDPNVQLVDTSDAPTMAPTLLALYLESGSGDTRRLVGVLELRITDRDRTVRTVLLKANEPITAELPGNGAAAMGQLMERLAKECFAALAGSS